MVKRESQPSYNDEVHITLINLIKEDLRRPTTPLHIFYLIIIFYRLIEYFLWL